MSTQTMQASPRTGQLNKLAVTAIVVAIIAIFGLWLSGIAGLAVFAVGAGHVSLHQISRRGESGRSLAIVALVVGYAIAVLVLFSSLAALPAMAQQFTM